MTGSTTWHDAGLGGFTGPFWMGARDRADWAHIPWHGKEALFHGTFLTSGLQFLEWRDQLCNLNLVKLSSGGAATEGTSGLRARWLRDG